MAQGSLKIKKNLITAYVGLAAGLVLIYVNANFTTVGRVEILLFSVVGFARLIYLHVRYYKMAGKLF